MSHILHPWGMSTFSLTINSVGQCEAACYAKESLSWDVVSVGGDRALSPCSRVYSNQRGPLFWERKHTFFRWAGKWRFLHFTARGGNRIEIKFSNDIMMVTPFQIILVSLYSAFMPQDAIWMGYLVCCFSEALRRPDDSFLAVGDWLLGVTSHHHVTFQVFNQDGLH